MSFRNLLWMGFMVVILGMGWCKYVRCKREKTSGWVQSGALAMLRLLGWQIPNIGNHASYKKAVVILAPHTSNWDFWYGMLFRFACPSIPIKFAIKREVMFFPLSYLMKALGAIPIERGNITHHKGKGMVAVMAHMLHESEALFLVIAPEGTRSYVNRWKTGFYRIAEAADLPIILGYINYATKEMGMGPIFHPTGDIDKDILTIQDFYRNIPGKYPKQGVI